ncbi:beta-propeller fold lactonase family protein [Paenibacillus sp. NPDC056579]|uniref:beta-propeller fold lactonase family protein n=1 Tax=Paenibacillus sp. NPDC056579 TaxID=3345871 RepID=UPI00368EF45D
MNRKHNRSRNIARLLLMMMVVLALAGCQLQPDRSGQEAPAPIPGLAGQGSAAADPTLPPTPTPAPAPKQEEAPAAKAFAYSLMITHSKSNTVSFVNPESGVIEKQLEAGTAPFALALDAGSGRAYVSTAEGVAVVDTKQRKRTALVPYQSAIQAIKFGEYRPGGMGIAVSPDGRFVYVGVYLPGKASQVEILDTEKLAIVGAVPVGTRPFDVVVSKDGNEVYSIDHDSYSVTIVDPMKRTARKIDVAPYGKGGFEKPHYAVIREDGHLLLPYQGRGLVDFDPVRGTYETKPLNGNSHQEGVALTPDGTHMLIIGNGAAGSATGSPNLTVLDMRTLGEKIIPLNRVHQMVASSPDGKLAYLTGGVTYADTGWDGLTIVDLEKGTTKEMALPDYPLDVKIVQQQPDAAKS